MSTRGRFFGISKKRKAGVRALFAALLWAVLGLFQTTCIVTDEIKFEDETNHPPEVLESVPAEALYIVCMDSGYSWMTETFEVTVWDPDDQPINEIEAKYIVDLDPPVSDEEPRIRSCNKPIELESESEQMDSGSVIHITCYIEVPISSFESYPLRMLKIRVSDKGFNSLDIPNEGARTTEVTWALKAEECF